MEHYLEGHSTSPRVMIPATRAFHQTARSGAHGFRSHRLRPLLMLCKYCRIRANRDRTSDEPGLTPRELELHHRGAPGKARTEGIQAHDVVLANPALAFGFVESYRDRCSRSVAVLIDVDHNLVHGNAETVGQRNDNPSIGLVRNNQ